LNASELAEIRSSIKNANASNKVYKNRVASIAFKDAGKEEIIDHLKGPSSFLFIDDETSDALRELNKFIKDNDKISFKAGYIDGKFYDKESITEIAALPSKDDLLSMLISALQGTIRNLAYAVSQIAQSKPADGAGEEVKEEAAKKEQIEEETSETNKEETSENTSKNNKSTEGEETPEEVV